jgi:hypothetical protein
MRQVLPTRRLLASDGQGWQVRELIDGAVHLVLRTPGIIFSRDEFTAWCWLLDNADGPLPAQNALLAVAAPDRQIGFLHTEGHFVLHFDEYWLTLQPQALRRIAALCRHAQRGLAAPAPVIDAEHLIWN